MGDELLKKTAAGNLFMVFGEPDIQPVDEKTGKIKPGADGKIQIEIKGVWMSTTRPPGRSEAPPPTTSPAGS